MKYLTVLLFAFNSFNLILSENITSLSEAPLSQSPTENPTISPQSTSPTVTAKQSQSLITTTTISLVPETSEKEVVVKFSTTTTPDPKSLLIPPANVESQIAKMNTSEIKNVTKVVA
jgi:hypothetical protein